MHQRNLTKQCVVYSLMCIFPSFVSTPFALSFFKNAVNLLTEMLSLLNLIIFSPVCYPVTTLMTNNQEDKHGKPNYDRAFCIRMKSTLTKRGCHFKSSGYRVVLLLGKMRPQYSYTHTKKSSAPIMGFIGLAIALPPPSVHEVNRIK